MSPRLAAFWEKYGDLCIVVVAVTGIAVHLALRFLFHADAATVAWPLYAVLALGGTPLVLDLAGKALRGEFGSDLLAGISIVASAFLDQHLAGSFVVLMLSGGTALERYAVRRASSVLQALARRMPSISHRKEAGKLADVSLDQVQVGDLLVVLPHEICPVDGVVVEGHGVMDESYLTGEPYEMSKTPGSNVLSGAINGESALTLRAARRAVDSRYARIMEVMRDSEQKRPRLRRLGDKLGAIYTPVAVGIALAAWIVSGDPVRFLAVLVIATPCPLLIGIPVAIIGAISLSAKRGIIIKDPTVLEQIQGCSTIILDKTGTLSYGKPVMTEVVPAPGVDRAEVLRLTAALEQYSKHPLAASIVAAARAEGLPLLEATRISEKPGAGLSGEVAGRDVELTSRHKLLKRAPELAAPGLAAQGWAASIPPRESGMEAMVLLDGRYAATLRFRDEPRTDSRSFIDHLGPKHRYTRVLLVSGDQHSEVTYLAEKVGITEVFAEQSPEDKVRITREESAKAPTLFLGDGINDAPALTAATVGVAFGQNSDITTEAAGAVIMDSSLVRVDEFFHIGQRLRTIALQSAVGGMVLSVAGMVVAAFGHLPPVAGAIGQEIIDLAVVLNALRAALPPRRLHDY